MSPELRDPKAPMEWIDIADFTPGIHSGFFGANGQPVGDGAARDTTWGCVGHPSGGLIPGPRLVRTIDEALPASIENNAAVPQLYVITGFLNLSPMRFDRASTDRIPGESVDPYGSPPDMLVITASYKYQDFALTYRFASEAVAYKFFAGNIVQSSIIASMRDAVEVVGVDTEVWGPGGVAIGRSVRYSETPEGNPGRIALAAILAGYPYNSAAYLFPNHIPATADDVSDTDTSVFDSSTNVNNFTSAVRNPLPAAPILVHQGRLLYAGAWLSKATGGFGSLMRVGSGASVAAPERIAYTPANDWYQTFAEVMHTNVFVEDKPFGIGAAISVNADTLFVVKTNGGAYAVTGSLDSPRITRLPGVASTGIARNVPCATPLGVVYGSNRGVWLWQSGDVSVNISPQLDGWFWKPDDEITDNMAGEVGSFAYQEPFVFAPNNWIFDTRSKAWWRFGKPDVRTYAWHSPSASGEMLCGPLAITDEQTTLCDWYDTAQGTSRYHFDSHPVQRTKGRLLNFRGIRVVAQGVGVITITITALNGQTAKEEFAFTTDEAPEMIELSTDLDGMDCTYTIDAVGQDFETPAPTIYRIGLGVLPRAGINAS